MPRSAWFSASTLAQAHLRQSAMLASGCMHVIGREQRVVDLQDEAGVDDRPVLLVQRVGDGVEIFLVALVMLVAVPVARLVGDTAGMNASSIGTPAIAAFRLAMSRCSAAWPL